MRPRTVTNHKPALSVLVCTLSTRVNKFLPSLIEDLHKQAEGHPVEILFLGDNKRMSVGDKRNKLLEMASGRYTCFVDDDDRIAPNYIKSIMSVLSSQQPDVVTFQAQITTNGKDPRPVFYSRNYKKDFDKGRVHYRIPNHLMVIRSQLTKRTKFQPINHGEDRRWAINIYPHLRKEVVIPGTLYYYDFNTETSETYAEAKRRGR